MDFFAGGDGGGGYIYLCFKIWPPKDVQKIKFGLWSFPWIIVLFLTHW